MRARWRRVSPLADASALGKVRPVKAFNGAIARSTQGNCHILDITEDLQALVAESGVQTGQLSALAVGSTAALSTIEFEPGLVNVDVAAALERLAPAKGCYQHEAAWHDDNGHSHVRATLTGPSLSLPVIRGRVPLGVWQQVVLIDYDTRPRSREVAVTVLGV